MASNLMFVALLAFAVCYSSVADPVRVVSELQLQAHQEFKQLVESFIGENGSPQMSDGPVRKGYFEYKNCGDPQKEVVVVSSMDIQPDPIHLPGTLKVSFESVIKSKFGSPVKAKLTVEQKFFGMWVEIPCVDGVGSCTYDNVCDMLAVKVKTCPPALVKQGFTCRCPVSPTKVSLKGYKLPVEFKFREAALIRVKIELTSGNTFITCMQMTLGLA